MSTTGFNMDSMENYGVAAPSVENIAGLNKNNILGNQSAVSGYDPNQFSSIINANGVPGVTAPSDNGWLSQTGMFGGTAADGTKTGGWVSPALNTFTGLTSAWLGMQQYGLAKDALKESKKQFKANYNNQAQLTNTEMEDRQRARVASAGSGASAYQSVGDYMDKNKVKEYG